MSVITKAWSGLLCGAALAALPTPAIGQDPTTNGTTTTYDRTVTRNTDNDHKDFPWGLLGLLGLGGLLGLKRRDDAADINVDARRNKRP